MFLFLSAPNRVTALTCIEIISVIFWFCGIGVVSFLVTSDCFLRQCGICISTFYSVHLLIIFVFCDNMCGNTFWSSGLRLRGTISVAWWLMSMCGVFICISILSFILKSYAGSY
jgi:hypothetical protein